MSLESNIQNEQTQKQNDLKLVFKYIIGYDFRAI